MAKRILPYTCSLESFQAGGIEGKCGTSPNTKVAKIERQQHHHPPEDTSIDDPSDGYLTDILSNYGLQLSPRGSHVLELEETPSDSSISLDCGEGEEGGGGGSSPTNTKELLLEDPPAIISASTFPGSKFRKIIQLQMIKSKVALEEKEQDEGQAMTSSPISQEFESSSEKTELPNLNSPTESTISSGGSSPKIRVKKYEVQPLDDPEEERKRINAVNARKNRVKQKKYTSELTKQNKSLENINSQCSKALKKTISETAKLQRGLEEKQQLRRTLEEELKKKKDQIRQQQEQLRLFQGHLGLIGQVLDDDNPTKNLIANLIKKFPS